MGAMEPAPRKIIHIDMDAYYASVEQNDHPELRGKPVVVGGDPSKRGVVAAASYEARKFGIRSAMSAAHAKRLCPHAVFVFPRISRYSEVSDQIHEVFQEVTDKIEPLSLDEAYLDVTTNKLGEPLARNLAVYLKKRIREVTGLTASAGVGPNKFVAKIASDLRKPDGLVVVAPSQVEAFVANLPVEKLWGVGPATAKRLHDLGIKTTADLRARELREMDHHFGKFGHFLFALAFGEDDREVETSWEPKSRGSETTFEKDILNETKLLAVIDELAAEISLDLKRIERPARTVSLKLRYSDFTTITRSKSVLRPIDEPAEISALAAELLYKDTEVGVRPIRLLGLSMSSFVSRDEPEQLWLTPPLGW